MRIGAPSPSNQSPFGEVNLLLAKSPWQARRLAQELMRQFKKEQNWLRLMQAYQSIAKSYMAEGYYWDASNPLKLALQVYQNKSAEIDQEKTHQLLLETGVSHLLMNICERKNLEIDASILHLDEAKKFHIQINESSDCPKEVKVLNNLFGARLMTNIAHNDMLHNRYDEMLEHASLALKNANLYEAPLEIGRAQLYIGIANFNLDKPNEALINYKNALSIGAKNGLANVHGVALSNIGNIYKLRGSFRKAIKAYSRALSLYSEIGNRLKCSSTLRNIAETHLRASDLPASNFYLHRSIHMSTELKDLLGLALSNFISGRLAFQAGEIEESMAKYNLALEYFKQKKSVSYLLKNLIFCVEDIYSYINQNDGVIPEYLNQNLALLADQNGPFLETEYKKEIKNLLDQAGMQQS